jgi:hypothetical protein
MQLQERGTKPVIPNRSCRKQPFSVNKRLYKARWLIENETSVSVIGIQKPIQSRSSSVATPATLWHCDTSRQQTKVGMQACGPGSGLREIGHVSRAGCVEFRSRAAVSPSQEASPQVQCVGRCISKDFRRRRTARPMRPAATVPTCMPSTS